MNKKLVSFSLFIFLIISSICFSQNEASKKTVQNGKEFYVYEVKAGESLYKISKSFGIPQEEIIQNNPEATSGVKSGMTLKIPVVSARKSTIKTAAATSHTPATAAPIAKKAEKEAGPTTHKVEKGETMFSICKRYQVDKESLLKANPSLSNGPKVGEEIIIPVKAVKAKAEKASVEKTPQAEKTEKKEFIDHVVVAKETIYSISRKYGASVSEINKYNQEELKNGLKIGQHLRIPTKAETNVAPAHKAAATTIAKPAAQKATPSVAHEEKIMAPATPHVKAAEAAPAVAATVAPKHMDEAKASDKMVHVALLLPFMINDVDKQDATINKFVEFYEGFLLGVNKLKDEGMSVELSTYDIEKSEEKVKEVLQKNSNIRKADLIIGPAYTSQVKTVADFAQANNIPVVVPFSSKIEALSSNPYIYQNNCPMQKQYVQASKLFLKNFSDKNIIIVHFNNDLNDEGSEFSRHLVASLKRQKVAFHDVLFTQENFANLQKKLTSGKETILILGTDKPLLIKELLPKIAQLNTESTPISVVGFSSWGKVIKSYPSTYYFSQFFVSKNNKDNGAYKEKFKQEFGFSSTASPKFDLMGFDLSTYFIKAIAAGGKDDAKISTFKQEHSLQSKFHFQKAGAKGGYINDGVMLIHYAQNKDLAVVE